MQAILVESMMWVVGGIVVGVLALQTYAAMGRPRRASMGATPWKGGITITNNTRRRASSSLRRKAHGAVKEARARGTSQGAKPTAETKRAGPSIMSEFQICPSCRLVAPSDLMEEHFRSSPLHREGRSQGAVEDDGEFREKAVSKEDPAMNGLLRSLMRLLVPPRAFGFRGQERTVDPLHRVIQRSSVLENIPVSLGPIP